MFNDFSEILKEFMKKLLSSRLVILAVVFVGLYAILGMRLFNLQIMEGEQYQENYMAKTGSGRSRKAISSPSSKRTMWRYGALWPR